MCKHLFLNQFLLLNFNISRKIGFTFQRKFPNFNLPSDTIVFRIQPPVPTDNLKNPFPLTHPQPPHHSHHAAAAKDHTRSHPTGPIRDPKPTRHVPIQPISIPNNLRVSHSGHNRARRLMTSGPCMWVNTRQQAIHISMRGQSPMTTRRDPWRWHTLLRTLVGDPWRSPFSVPPEPGVSGRRGNYPFWRIMDCLPSSRREDGRLDR